MTRYYFEVIKEGLSVCVDSDINYHYEFSVGEIIAINMYSDRGTVLFGEVEYAARFIYEAGNHEFGVLVLNSLRINFGLTNCYLSDVTVQVERDRKLGLILK
jgi:hypothetical protein